MSDLTSAVSFLTGTPQNVTGQQANQSQTTTSLPDWYTSYTQQILNTAAQYAAQPYQAYQGPRIASPTGLTTGAEAGAAGLTGISSGAAQTASNLLTGATNSPTASQASAGSFNTAGGLYNTAASNANAGSNAAQPGLTQSNNQVGSALSSPSGLSVAQPGLSSASSMYGASVNPGLSGSAAAAGSLGAAEDPTYNSVQNYMSPYTQDVTNQIATLANQNFNENTLPSLNNQFISAGNITGGSTQEANLANIAARNNQLAISNAQAGALESGYNTALNAAGQQNSLDANVGATQGALANENVGNIQNAAAGTANVAGTAGNLASTGINQQLTGANQYANNASTAGGLANSGEANLINSASGVTGLGNSQANAASTTTQNQLNASQLAANEGTTALSNQTSALGTQNQLGLQEQGQTQSNLNLAYQDYLNQLNYPMQQVQALQTGLNGIQIPTTTSNSNLGTTTGAGTSVANQILGGLGQYVGATGTGTNGVVSSTGG